MLIAWWRKYKELTCKYVIVKLIYRSLLDWIATIYINFEKPIWTMKCILNHYVLYCYLLLLNLFERFLLSWFVGVAFNLSRDQFFYFCRLTWLTVINISLGIEVEIWLLRRRTIFGSLESRVMDVNHTWFLIIRMPISLKLPVGY